MESLRRELIANVSKNDLRTPLTMISGYRVPRIPGESRRRISRSLSTRRNYLTKLVNDMLTFPKHQSGIAVPGTHALLPDGTPAVRS